MSVLVCSCWGPLQQLPATVAGEQAHRCAQVYSTAAEPAITLLLLSKSLSLGGRLAITVLLLGLQLFAWGWGRYGNLGDGEKTDRHLPTHVKLLKDVQIRQVSCGWRHSAAATTEGLVYTFGWSKYGQLGHGSYE